MKTIYSKYSNDVITSCGLGIECNSLENEKNIFYKMGLDVNSPNIGRALRLILAGFFPKLFEVRLIVQFRIYFLGYYCCSFSGSQ